MVENLNILVESIGSESQSSDFVQFEQSLQHLHERLLKDYFADDSPKVIVALSRKGPKMVNTIFTEKERAQLNIVTEFAIPILFAHQAKGSTLQILILDDAIYYGSTLLNLYNEIKRYELLYGINLPVKAYVAVRDESALYFNNFEVFADKAYREGFGHFFVREAMSRFRRLHQCMEVEFPSVTYSFSHSIDVDALISALKETFNNNCYTEEYNEGSIISIVLPRRDSLFSKSRLYIDINELHVTFMSPRIIPNDENIIRRLMSEMDAKLIKIWDKICDEMLKEAEDAKTVEVLKRSRRRNVVSLANYIFSFEEYILYKSDLEQAFHKIDSHLERKSLNADDFYQILGSMTVASELCDYLDKEANYSGARFPVIPSVPILFDGLRYEELRNPTEEERQTLESHNRHMIRNSHSYKEALSAIFFNQNLFIERWSRTKARYETRHLWFGYTHDILQSLLEKYGRFEQPVNSELELHKWIDNRIDMGCVVPQYILDYASNQWIRVFRPGENEELLLSHLARYVIHIYNKVDERLGLGYVPDHFLRNMLSTIYKRYWMKGLADQFQFTLELSDDRNLTLSSKDSEGRTEVIKYLQKMYILEDNDGEITIAPRITDEEFKNSTTIDNDLLNTIDQFVTEVMDKFDESGLSVDRDYSIFNYYLNDDLTDEQLIETYQRIADRILQAVKMIDIGIDIGDRNFVNSSCETILLESYHQLIDYDVEINMFLSGEGITTERYWSRFETDARFRTHTQVRRLIYILNLLIAVYAIADFENFKNFAQGIVVGGYLKLLGLEELCNYLNSVLKADNLQELHTTHKLTRQLRRILEQIAS